jgi:hypothetical protein
MGKELDLSKNPIERGRTWRQVLQRGQNHIQIVGSTDATPIVVTVDRPHGYTNGEKIRIVGHDSNSTANGNQTAANVTTKTFEVGGVAGNGIGRRDGMVMTCIDGTNVELTIEISGDPTDVTISTAEDYTGPDDVLPVISWLTRDRYRIELLLTHEQTALMKLGLLNFEIIETDAAGEKRTVFEGTVPVID